MHRHLYVGLQFFGCCLQVIPVLLLIYAPFTDQELKMRKGRLVTGIILIEGIACGIAAVLLGSIYDTPDFEMWGRWWANIMFLIIWIGGTLLYFGSVRKGSQRRLLCYMMALQYGMASYAAAEILSKWIYPDAHYSIPYSTEAVVVYLVMFATVFPVVYRFLKRNVSDTMRSENSRSIRLITSSSCVLLALFCIGMLAEVGISQFVDHWVADAWLSIWMLCTLIMDLLVYYIYFRCLRFEREKELAYTQIAALELQFQSVQDKIEKEKRFYHDMRHHFRTLISLTEEGQHDQVAQYLRIYLEEWEKSKEEVLCRNPLVNGILSYYAAQAEEGGIHVQVDADIKEYYPFAPTDMTVLLGNAMENALEASRQYEGADPYIRVLMRQRKKRLLIQVDNCCKAEPLRRHPHSQDILSSKRGRISGYGIRSMRTIVQRYQGDLECRKEGEQFILRMVLNIPEEDAVKEEKLPEESLQKPSD